MASKRLYPNPTNTPKIVRAEHLRQKKRTSAPSPSPRRARRFPIISHHHYISFCFRPCDRYNGALKKETGNNHHYSHFLAVLVEPRPANSWAARRGVRHVRNLWLILLGRYGTTQSALNTCEHRNDTTCSWHTTKNKLLFALLRCLLRYLLVLKFFVWRACLCNYFKAQNTSP